MPYKKEFLNPEKILKEINAKEEMIIADFGCGSGFFTLPAAQWVGENGIVYAVDIQKSSLERIENQAKDLGANNIKFVWADLEIFGSTKILQESVDRIIIVNLFFQTKKQKQILEEAKRILKKDGKILILDWKTSGISFGPKISLRISEEETQKIANEVGFALERIFEAGEYHYGLIFKIRD